MANRLDSLDAAGAAELLERMIANLASQNEIIASLVQGACANSLPEQEWADLVWTTLRDHSWRLGYEFNGDRPDAEWLEKEEAKRDGT